MTTWIMRRGQSYARGVLLAGLLLSPVLYQRTTLEVFNLVKLTILFVSAVVAVALWVLRSLQRGVWLPRLRVFWVAGAFLLIQALATILSENRAVSLLGIYSRYGGLIPFLLYATIALAIVGLYWERPEDLRQVPRVITAASFLVACDVLMQRLGLDWIPWRNPGAGYSPSFPVGTFGNSNFAGGFLAVAAPLFLYVVLSAGAKSRRRLLAGAFAIDLVALWFTQTRGALIGVGLAVAGLAFISRDKLPRWVRRLTLAGVLGAGLLFVLAVLHPGMRQPPSLFSKAGSFSPFRTGTFQDRSYYWIAALRIFRRHPLLGTGPDTYALNYTRFRLAQDGAKLGLLLTNEPHNIFVGYAADSGALGLGSYVALLGFALRWGYRRARRLEGDARLLLVMFMGSLLAYAGQGFFSIDVVPIAVMGWVALAGIAVMAGPVGLPAMPVGAPAMPVGAPAMPVGAPARPVGASGGAGRRHLVSARSLMAAVTLVIALGLLSAGVRPYRADRLAFQARGLQEQAGPPSQVADAFLHASALLPTEPTYLDLAGRTYELAATHAADSSRQDRLYELALGPYRRALDLQPTNVFYAMNLARVQTSWAANDATHYAVAAGLWQSAVGDDPTDWQVHERYALMLTAWASSDPTNPSLTRQGAAEFQTVVGINPGDVTAWVHLVRLYRSLGQPTQAAAALTRAQGLSPGNADVAALQPVTASPGANTGG